MYAGAIGTNINVAIASTNSAVYVAWQDSRNGRPNTQHRSNSGAPRAPATT